MHRIGHVLVHIASDLGAQSRGGQARDPGTRRRGRKTLRQQSGKLAGRRPIDTVSACAAIERPVIDIGSEVSLSDGRAGRRGWRRPSHWARRASSPRTTWSDARFFELASVTNVIAALNGATWGSVPIAPS